MELPIITRFTPKTKRGASRQYTAVLRMYKRAFDGGGASGWDWPTLRMNWPEGYAYLQALKDGYSNLPE